MKKLFALLPVLLLAFVLCGCCIRHDWQPATCTEPSTCSKCGKTQGEPLGHTEAIDEAVAPTCTETGLTEGHTAPSAMKSLSPRRPFRP